MNVKRIISTIALIGFIGVVIYVWDVRSERHYEYPSGYGIAESAQSLRLEPQGSRFSLPKWPRSRATAVPAPRPTAAPAPRATAAPAATAAPPSSLPQTSPPAATTFRDNRRLPTISTAEDAVSTFSLDTDRTSFWLALNWISQGHDVEPDSVRAEEWINSFNYGYAPPVRDDEFGIYSDVFRHPLDGSKHMARLGFQAPTVLDDDRPVNVTLVLDASGSMQDGNRFAIARAAAESIRNSLDADDRIAVVHFSNDVIFTQHHVAPSSREAREAVARLSANGSTNVQAGLNKGVRMAQDARWLNPYAINYIILMSDGVANVDATNPFAILETASDVNTRNPLRLITIGVGINNYNDYLLEQLAQHGNGWYRYLDSEQQARSTFDRDNWLQLSSPFADQTRAQVTWDPEFVDEWRIVGYENRVTDDALFTQDRKEFAEIPSGTATTVFYELRLNNRVANRQASTAKLGDVELRWVDPDSGESREQYGSVSGHWRQDFQRSTDSMLKLGTIVALAADRYSAIPDPWWITERRISDDLGQLNHLLRPLEGSIGHTVAYRDFTTMLDHMARYQPVGAARYEDTGYSR